MRSVAEPLYFAPKRNEKKEVDSFVGQARIHPKSLSATAKSTGLACPHRASGNVSFLSSAQGERQT
jgi:hypothetical protein